MISDERQRASVWVYTSIQSNYLFTHNTVLELVQSPTHLRQWQPSFHCQKVRFPEFQRLRHMILLKYLRLDALCEFSSCFWECCVRGFGVGVGSWECRVCVMCCGLLWLCVSEMWEARRRGETHAHPHPHPSPPPSDNIIITTHHPPPTTHHSPLRYSPHHAIADQMMQFSPNNK